MIRPSSLSDRLTAAIAIACVIASSGCGRRPASGPVFPTSAELPATARRPDGVVVDPEPELPAPSEATRTEASLAVLRAPLAEKLARAVVFAFFRCVVSEDVDAMAELLTSDAAAPTKSRASTPSLLDHWRGRIRHLKYRLLAAETVYDETRIEIYRYGDLEAALPGRPARPPSMTASDLLARVPISTVRAGSDRLFGDEIVFVLHRDKYRYRIRETIEDFQLP